MDISCQDQAESACTRAHEPFKLSERLYQLSEIDNDITALLSLTNDALIPLAFPITGPGVESSGTAGNLTDPAAINTEAQVAAFKEALDSFLSTLHSVDVRLKRQIWGLEEAGIVSLKEAQSTSFSLEPNGVGDIGNLDVGWLNSRSNKVDRDMEAELWTKLKVSLERIHETNVTARTAEISTNR